jgi:hypothetical protein
MATKQELRTFKQIQDQIMGLMKYQSTDTVNRDRIKSDIQRAYLTEIMPFHQWPWLRGKVNVQTEAYHGTGTATVTQNSVTVTLSDTLVNSRKGYYFSVNGQNEIYKIKSHTGGTTSLTLDMPYTGQTSSTATFKIWRDYLPLPAEVTDIIEVTHPFLVNPMTGVGLQELRRISAMSPKSEGRPGYFTLDDWVDPDPYSTVSGMPATTHRASSGLVKTIVFASSLGSSVSTLLLQTGDRIQISGAGDYDYNIEAIVSSVSTTTNTNDTITYTALDFQTESSTADTGITVKKLNTESYERQRQLLIYPSIFNSKTNISVDYIRETEPLVDDADEPSLPLSDRVVLFWLGLSYAYSRERNPEEAMMYRQMAEARLARMAGQTNESTDKPMLVPSKAYLTTKRHAIRNRSLRGDSIGFGGGGSTTNPLGTPSTAAVFGSDGTLQALGTVSTTELSALDGIVGNIEDRLNALGLDSNVSTGNKVLISDNSTPPAIAESTVTSSELVYLAGVESLTSVSLIDNTASPTSIASWDTTLYDSLHILYSIKRGSNMESGTIVLTHDGTNAAIAQGGIASLGTSGVTLTTDVSAGSIRLLYTTTSTGSGATFKYKVQKWLA